MRWEYAFGKYQQDTATIVDSRQRPVRRKSEKQFFHYLRQPPVENAVRMIYDFAHDAQKVKRMNLQKKWTRSPLHASWLPLRRRLVAHNASYFNIYGNSGHHQRRSPAHWNVFGSYVWAAILCNLCATKPLHVYSSTKAVLRLCLLTRYRSRVYHNGISRLQRHWRSSNPRSYNLSWWRLHNDANWNFWQAALQKRTLTNMQSFDVFVYADHSFGNDRWPFVYTSRMTATRYLLPLPREQLHWTSSASSIILNRRWRGRSSCEGEGYVRQWEIHNANCLSRIYMC